VGWKAQLTLRYTHEAGENGGHTGAHDRHEGPLRVLQRLYPEGPAICHHVIVHPPGGVVGGDELRVDAELAPGAHAVITTPGATRFYRSEGATALQAVRLRLAAGARLEWLPMETIAYSGCVASSALQLELAPGAETLGWDVLALGLPAAGQAFEQGAFEQRIELPGRWLERGVVRADDPLLRSPLGWAGHSVLATAWWAAGEPLPSARRDALLDATRACTEAHALKATAGVTAAQPQVLVLRVLAPRVEPAMQLLMQVRAAWRQAAWGLAAEPPRIWRT
jgi:urease accessory protein